MTLYHHLSYLVVHADSKLKNRMHDGIVSAYMLQWCMQTANGKTGCMMTLHHLVSDTGVC
jgi:hypothetical protein